MRILIVLLALPFLAPSMGYPGTVVFYEPGFPSVENGGIGRAALERALAQLNPRFVGLAGLTAAGALAEGDLLVLPFGSAVPADAWEAIARHLESGDLLVLGGRPFAVPVRRDSAGWTAGAFQNTYSRSLGIAHSYPARIAGGTRVAWDEEAPFFHGARLTARQVFVNAGFGGRYRGIGYLIDDRENRLAAPVVADDLVGGKLPPRRRVFLSFDADSTFWNSSAGNDLMLRSALYASRGGLRLWIDLQRLSLGRGERVSGAVDVLRRGGQAELTVEVLSGTKALASRTTACGNSLHEPLGLDEPLASPGLYRIRATISAGDTAFDRYTTGVVVRDPGLLASGKRLAAGGDFFTLDGEPYLMVGTNYFSTDPYTSGFFVGGSIGGNAWVWERDFEEMARQGLTIVRTGIWLNRMRYLDNVSGAADERLLGALEAFLSAAARHRMQVIFTFFAFDPQTELDKGAGQGSNRLGPGSNPYLDPVSIAAQLSYVRSIVTRFRDVPFLSYDLINEPSFSNPGRLWKGNSPNGDPAERAAWGRWLEDRYGTLEKLGDAWRTPPAELEGFHSVPLPEFADLELTRYGNHRLVRAVDYNLFAQDSFRRWVDTLAGAIRASGSIQLITVGQDEGGVTDRVLTQFWAESKVDYTANHSWWRDDALLWNSLAAKSPHKPCIIGETGPQPVWAMDGSWRWDDPQGMPLLERKLALGFAAANGGVLHWDWTRSDNFGLLRRDGSQKEWLAPLSGIAGFARQAQGHATSVILPEIALVLPQSLQLSTFGTWSISVQQNSVRALYHHARAAAFAVGEYQLERLPQARLIIVPAPWVLRQQAWDVLMARARAGATLLISGRIDADEHWISVPGRAGGWGDGYAASTLTTREVRVGWPGDSAQLSYPGEITTYAERGVLPGGQEFLEAPLGLGRILYFAPPLEAASQLDAVGRIYRFAMSRAGVQDAYTTDCPDPGILICPTRLQDGTLYVLTSESAEAAKVRFRDAASGKDFSVDLAPNRAALLLVGRDGRKIASYNVP